MMKISLSKNNKCKHECCNNEKAPKRSECYKCRSVGIRERKPIDMCYYELRKSAKRRQLEFTIELVWFRGWVATNGYMEGKGRASESLNIDRIKNLLGYTPDNIQILTKHDNVHKFWSEDEKRVYIVAEIGPQHEGPLPF